MRATDGSTLGTAVPNSLTVYSLTACRPCRSGFTLLELLIAITLMAVITGALYSSLYVAFKAERSAQGALQPARSAALALQLLQQDFDAALPPNGILAGAFEGTAGTGIAGSAVLTFYSGANVPRDGETGGNIRQVSLCVQTLPDDPQPVLVRQVTANLLASADPVIRTQVLCRRIKAFNLSYFDGSLWQDNWDSTGVGNVLPLAIQVTLQFALDAPSAGAPAPAYQITRIYRIPCGRPVTAQTAGNG